MEGKIIEWEEGWSCILSGVTKLKMILEGESEPTIEPDQYMHIYGTIYSMCTQKRPHEYKQQLYDKYREVIEDYVKQTVVPSLREKHGVNMLKELVKRWDNHKVMVSKLSLFFLYLEHQCRLPLKDVGLRCFRDLVYNKEMWSKAKEAIQTLIHKEREGEQIDRKLLKNVLDIIVENEMGKMETYIENFVQDTASYYSRKASSWIQEDSCPVYMLKCEECVEKEREKVTHYFHSSTPKLVEMVENELLVVFAKQLLENEHSWCHALLRDDKRDDLSRMYRLCYSIPQVLELVANLFKQHVTEEGNILIKQAEDAATNQAANSGGVQEHDVISKVIVLRDKYMVYVTECFHSHNLFHKALEDAFEIFCNKKVAGSSSAELLATFCDNLFRKGGGIENLSDEAIEATLESVVKLLVYISDKDIFAEFYRKKLARRLLFDRSGSEDLERSILTKLKEEFGEQFTSKMEDMVTDMTLARENQMNFEEYLSSEVTTNLGIDLTVTVLTTGFWPSYKTCGLNLPSEMVKCVEIFKSFYETKTEHRKLEWIYSLGTCHIIGKFDQKPIDLIVSTYEAAVLLLFNNTERISYNEISEQLNLNHEDLIMVLHSLSCAKYKILTKEPMSENISQNDVFEFNSKFTDRMQRITDKKVVEDVEKDRRYAIDASLVKIMKSKKVLGYQLLIHECVKHLSGMFKPDIKMIKKRIEDLSREIIWRGITKILTC